MTETPDDIEREKVWADMVETPSYEVRRIHAMTGGVEVTRTEVRIGREVDDQEPAIGLLLNDGGPWVLTIDRARELAAMLIEAVRLGSE